MVNYIRVLLSISLGLLPLTSAYAYQCQSTPIYSDVGCFSGGSYKGCKVTTLIQNQEFGDQYHLRLPREKYENLYTSNEINEEVCQSFCSEFLMIPIPFDGIYHFPKIFPLSELLRLGNLLQGTYYRQDIVKYIIESAHTKFSPRGGTYFHFYPLQKRWFESDQQAFRRQASLEIDRFYSSLSDRISEMVDRPVPAIILDGVQSSENF